jgi:two-component system chemotaxis sensor kinase CheA
MSDFIDAELMRDFLVECGENISQLDNDLVTLEQNSSDLDILKRIFRSIHTVKGTCGMFGLSRLEKIAHAAEDVLGKMREGQLLVTPETISPVLKAVDIIKFILGKLESEGKEPVGDDSDVIAVLHAIFKGEAPQALNSAPSTVLETPSLADAASSANINAASEAQNGAHHAPTAADQTLRVHVDVIDQLMNTVGELVLTRNQLVQLIRGVDESQFSNPINQLNRVTSQLQESVMKTRMQPIGVVWSKLPRIVRDLAASSGKKLELHTVGQETEMDRQILQSIGDPLIHLIRNSADHGIEAPDVRVARGKKATGIITLRASQEGGQIVIEISDDGAGISAEKILAKAIQKNLLKADQAKSMSETEILNMIFEPGFSTAEQITEVSGRGVGMDVVRSNIEKIGGNVEISTKLGIGTTMRITIPLTLAIISALIVRVGDSEADVFALPQSSVLELVRITPETSRVIESIQNAKFLRLRDSLLPLIDMREMLGFERTDTAKEFSVVICQIGESRFGLMSQEVFDTQEVVVKSPGRYLRGAGIYSGATILGDGRVILILDVARLSELGLSGVAHASAQAAQKSLSEQNQDSFADQLQILLVKSFDKLPLAVPLALVSRLEEFPVERVEVADGRNFVQYRGGLLPLLGIKPDWKVPSSGTVMAVIFSDGKRSMGLSVLEICDVVNCAMKMEAKGTRPGVLGASVVEGQVTEVIDIYYYLVLAYPDWFGASEKKGGKHKGKRILYIDDSPIFRDMIKPLLESNGYHVMTAVDGDDALSVVEASGPFDLILSDIEMPNRDGWGFASEMRERGLLGSTPLLALTSLSDDGSRKKASDLGFSEYLVKLDQDQLLSSVRQRMPS